MKKLLIIALATTIITPLQGVAYAQQAGESLFKRDRNISVQQRQRPGYDAPEIRTGAFWVSPKLYSGVVFDDNVFAADENTESDVIGIVRPSVDIRSAWSIHSLKAGADITRNEYFDFGSESVTNFGANVDGQLDVGTYSYIRAGVSYRKAHEPRTSAGIANRAAEPIEFDVNQKYLSATHETGRTQFRATLSSADYNYTNAQLIGGGIGDQNFRDRVRNVAEFRGDYAISPDTAIFTRVKYIDQSYDEAGNISSRDQDGYVIDAGASFDLTNLVRGEIGVGYLNRDFKNNIYQDVDGFSLDGNLEWFPSPLVTVDLGAHRRVRPSALIASPAFLEAGLDLSAYYEARRNIIFSVGTSYNEQNYEGINRLDKRLHLNVGASYLMNRYVRATVGLEQRNLDSRGTNSQNDFDNTLLKFGIELRR